VLPAVRDTHEVVATFQLPCLTPKYGAKAEHYISHLVGHEGPGSLLSLLKVRHGKLYDRYEEVDSVMHLISHLLGHEGPGSLLLLLKVRYGR